MAVWVVFDYMHAYSAWELYNQVGPIIFFHNIIFEKKVLVGVALVSNQVHSY